VASVAIIKRLLKEKKTTYAVASYCFRRLKCMLKDKKTIRTYLSSHRTKKLHIGAGGHILEGWLNSDLYPSQGNLIHLDATKTFPINDCTFDYLFSEHMIEHFTYPTGLNMLKECHRVLKPGGRIRVATPDLLFLVLLYRPDKTPMERAYIQWSTDTYDNIQSGGSYEDTFVINNFFRDWGHRFIYDEKVLRHALAKVGFTNIVQRQMHESEDQNLRGLENDARFPNGFLDLETFILEAVKSVK
jgi:predicted SAM-dependent methyltransferase